MDLGIFDYISISIVLPRPLVAFGLAEAHEAELEKPHAGLDFETISGPPSLNF